MPWGTRRGGAERRLLTIVEGLEPSRVQADLIFLEEGPFAREAVSVGARSSVLAAGRLRDWRAFGRTVRSLVRYLEREQPDVLLSWGSKPQLYGGTAAALAATDPVNVWWMLEIPARQWLPVLATLLPAEAIGCSSRHVAGEQRRLMLPRRPTFVIHPGVHHPRQVPAAEREKLRSALGIPHARLVVGTVGRLQPWKNQHIVIDAIGHLVRGGRDVHAIVVGGTSHARSLGYEEELHQRAKDAGLAARISFAGHQSDVDPYYALFDVFVLGSQREPFGLVVLEAMARGVPVVAVSSAGPAEILEHGRTGWLVRTASEQQFAEAIAALADQPGLRRQMAVSARKTYERKFTVNRMVSEFQQEMERLAGAAAKPTCVRSEL
ncbi:MAG TPA: glycosyltransferase [Solirubrobacteraceae bacterium]|nr:glycosyltransferase [Solirubrobacteraceae bacterium]